MISFLFLEPNLAHRFYEPNNGVNAMTNSLKTLTGISNKINQTPQTQAIPGREADMAANNAGGVSFVVSPWDQLDR